MGIDSRSKSFRLLFVCSGNTCRSPLAAALAEREIAHLGWRVEVRSAGVSAMRGVPASTGSLGVGARHGLDLSGHLSRPVDDELLYWAHLILVMSPGHLLRLAQLGVAGKAAVLDAFAKGGEGDGEGAEVSDPFGGGDDDYERTYETLKELIGMAFRQLEPNLAP